VGFLALSLIGVPSPGDGAERGRIGCLRGDRIQIQDLDLSPDPIIEGQRIRAWTVRLRFDGNRECETEIEVREGGEVIGGTRRFNLRPGINDIEIQPTERFRFQRGEHCFTVVADLEGSRRQVDAARRFCARQRPSWTMREPGDRDRFGR
jgi:hypothetical protein